MIKKILAIICTILILGLCACDKNDSHEEASQTPSYIEKEITITTDNFKEYFIMNCYVENFREHKTKNLILNGFYDFDTSCDFVVTITPKSDVVVKNVNMKILITTTMDVSGNNLVKGSHLTYLVINLPQNGQYKTVLNCTHSVSLPISYFAEERLVKPCELIDSVAGTIIEKVEA